MKGPRERNLTLTKVDHCYLESYLRVSGCSDDVPSVADVVSGELKIKATASTGNENDLGGGHLSW